MFGRRITLFKLFGFEVKLDASWIVIALLIVWSLAKGFFPQTAKGLSTGTYWAMGAAGALGLFLSIVIHEFPHSLVARSYGLKMAGITLFIFGGVAEMTEEPESPKVEFWMAIAGPISSMVLGTIFLVLAGIAHAAGAGLALVTVTRYLGEVNILLAVFNLLPAFPLDGGRVLRSVLWRSKHSLQKATRTAARIGSGFGFFLMAAGVWQFFVGNYIGGIWWFLIGGFLNQASRTSYERVAIAQVLAGIPVSSVMRADPVTVDPATDLRTLVEDYAYRQHFRMYPVVRNGRLLGRLELKALQKVPSPEWSVHTVEEVMEPLKPGAVIPPDTEANKAFEQMMQNGNSRLLVAQGDNLRGVITLRDLLNFLSIKQSLSAQE